MDVCSRSRISIFVESIRAVHDNQEADGGEASTDGGEASNGKVDTRKESGLEAAGIADRQEGTAQSSSEIHAQYALALDARRRQDAEAPRQGKYANAGDWAEARPHRYFHSGQGAARGHFAAADESIAIQSTRQTRLRSKDGEAPLTVVAPASCASFLTLVVVYGVFLQHVERGAVGLTNRAARYIARAMITMRNVSAVRRRRANGAARLRDRM